MIIMLLLVINEMEDGLLSRNRKRSALCVIKALLLRALFWFSGFVLPLLESESMPGATSNVCSLYLDCGL